MRHFLQRWVTSSDVVLDIGCGQGEFLNHVRCARRIGVDLNPDAAASLGEGVEFHAGDVRDLSFQADDSVDLVFTSNLIEHLPSKADVETVFSEVRRVLKPGGHVVALGPNLRFLQGQYWDFWDHHVALSDQSAGELLELHGFKIDKSIPFFLPYNMVRIRKRPLCLVRLYLHLPFVWRFFGSQFLIVARKK